MMLDRFDEPWQEWRCCDCDPDLARKSGEEPEYEKPYIVLLPKGVKSPDFCGQCGDYLSMCEGASDLRITNTPAERWAAKRREEAEHERREGTR